ncbi:MAG: glycosyltransferase [Flavobacteriaceae bacterium]|nr:glycosyltransferase [Flavobacteriaceae bacterium]MCB9299004.1 glycosyltransferase [Lewinellaceae bacterium]
MANLTKRLFIISKNIFPDDLFLRNEVEELRKYFKKIYVYPIKSLNPSLCTSNCHNIINIPNQSFSRQLSTLSKLQILVKYFNIICEILFLEFHKRDLRILKKEFFLTLRRIIKNIDRSESITFDIETLKIIEGEKDIYFYSFWGEEEAFCLAFLKRTRKIDNLFIRLRGWDLYEERRENNYIPFQRYISKQASLISLQTKEAYNYFLKKYPFLSSKIILNHQGVYDNGENPSQAEKTHLRIVSCSNLVALKRVDQIVNILQNVKYETQWFHFGDGPEMDKIIELTHSLPKNIECFLPGRLKNVDILKFYKTEPVDLFIHLSCTEGGVPLALQEAASFGIPMIGTNVGGISEIIINGETGLLVPKNFNSLEIVDFINDFLNSNFAKYEKRIKIKEFWKSNFNAVDNYRLLAHQILNK